MGRDPRFTGGGGGGERCSEKNKIIGQSSGQGKYSGSVSGNEAQHLVGWYFDRAQEGDQFSWRLSALVRVS